MKRVLNLVGSFIGIGLLVVLAAVLVLTLRARTSEGPVALQQPYPTETPIRPTSPLPITPTLRPYPPPQTPTMILPGTPTIAPYPPPATPVPTLPPTLTTIPTPPIPTPPILITSTLQIIWAETTRITTEVGPNQPGIITFWRANIADLANRVSLATMPQGNSLKNASLSPDGSKIAFTTLPPPPNSRWWLLGTLWMMNVDGSGLKELAQGIHPGGWLGSHAPIWSPDSRTLIYLKLVPKELPTAEPYTPIVPPPPFRYELYSVTIDNAESKLLVADDIGLYPLGWSSDGALFYYQRATPRGWEFWAVESVGGKAPQFKAFMDVEPRNVRLSPDGIKLLFNTSEGLVFLSTDGKERRVFSPLFRWIWSPDSTEIIGRSAEPRIRALNVTTGAVRDILTDQQMFAQRISFDDELLSLSPGGRWLAIKSYETGKLYLSGIDSNVRIEVPGPGIRHTSYFIGWMPAG